jgi:diguanylate cyclase (GGDEF)-like protein
MMFISKITQRASTEHIKTLAKEETSKFNKIFEDHEKYTHTLAAEVYLMIQKDPTFFANKQSLEKNTEAIKTYITSSAHALSDAKSVYVRFSPEIAGPNAGAFYVKEDFQDSSFTQTDPTNITRFSPNDVEHVGWYYMPIQVGKPTWLLPYLNKNINSYIISYVEPMFLKQKEIGVVGVDIDFETITKHIAKIRLLQTGYAYLEDNEGYIAYHPTLTNGLSFKVSDDLIKISEPLSNGMSFVCIVPYSEINAQRNMLLLQCVIFILVLLALTTTLSIIFSKSITRPLKELTEEAKKMITGNMNAEFNIQQNDEIGDLAKSFSAAKFHINQYMKQMQGLAFRDSLTGVRNKMAYDSYLNELEEKIQNNEISSYGIIVLDTNNLKEINDTYGHENGNEYLINSCKLICQIFVHSPIFRIGGDEFIVILTGNDLKNHRELLNSFQKGIRSTRNAAFPWKQISIAYGIATTDHAKGTTIAETFNKADNNMYKNKRAMKNAELERQKATEAPQAETKTEIIQDKKIF